MHRLTMLGACGALLGFLSSFPQLLYTTQSKDVGGISVLSIYLSLCGAILWVLYGFGTHNDLIVLTYGGSFLICFVRLLQYYQYVHDCNQPPV